MLLAQIAGTAVPFLVIAAVTGVVVTGLTVGGATRFAGARKARTGEAAAQAGEAAARAGEATDRAGETTHRGSGSTSLRSLARQARHPGVGAAAGALMVSGAVSGVSQLLISSGLHHDGLSSARIGLAFSASALCYIAASAAVVRLGDRVRTLRFNAVATGVLSLALVPALASGDASALVLALLLTAMPRAAVSTIAYSLASASPEGGDGSAFGMVNGAWAAAMVFMPLVAGALEEHGDARAPYLAVIIPAVVVAAVLATQSRAGWSRKALPTPCE